MTGGLFLAAMFLTPLTEIVPRVAPRKEQLIRARRASELGLLDMLLPEQAEDPALLAAKLRKLPSRPRPSQSAPNLRLEGLSRISDLVGEWLEQGERRQFAVVDGTN